MRDNFSNKVKETLAKRVAYRCSNPLCDRRTTGPAEEPSHTISIGVAAHITAASINGPRYDPEISEELRKSVDNGIWLCQNCAKLIDSDCTIFSVQLLKEWKDRAESEARSQIESPTSEQNEVLKEIQTLRKDLYMSFYTLGHQKSDKDQGGNIAFAYLDAVLKITDIVEKDFDLFNRTLKSPCIGIDFSDLYAYVSANSNLLVSLPVVDFCINNSEIPLCLFPATVAEIHHFVNILLRREKRLNRGIDMKSLDDFVRLYESRGPSPETAEAYKRALHNTVRLGAFYWPGFSKLDLSLKGGKIIPLVGSEWEFGMQYEQSKYEECMNLFERYRPQKIHSNVIDAMNLAILDKINSDNQEAVRMISTGKFISKVSRKVFDGNNLIRKSKDFAILLRIINQMHGMVDLNYFREFVHATLNLHDVIRQMNIINQDLSGKLIGPFRDFSKYYRDILWPVDEMVRSSILAIPDKQEEIIREFYEILISHSKLANGFRSWWDNISEKLNSIQSTLEERYLDNELTKSIESKLK